MSRLDLGRRQVVWAGDMGPSEQVELDLRLRSRRPRGKPGSRPFRMEDQQVSAGLGQGTRWLVTVERSNLVILVVVHVGQSQPANLSRWPDSKRTHKHFDLGQPFATFKGFVDRALVIMTDIDIQVVEVLEDSLFPILDGGRQFGEEQ